MPVITAKKHLKIYLSDPVSYRDFGETDLRPFGHTVKAR